MNLFVPTKSFDLDRDCQTNRLFFCDALRVFAMAAIVTLHSSAPLCYAVNKGMNWYAVITVNVLTRFAVPCFVMISGYLLLGREENAFVFYKKRLFSMVVPFLTWSLFYSLWLVHLGGTVWQQFVSFLNSGVMYHLWFCYMMIGLYLLAPFVRVFCASLVDSTLIWLMLMLFLMSGFAGLAQTQYGVTHSLSYLFPINIYLGYFVLGFVLSKIDFHIKYLNFGLWFVVICSTLCSVIFTISSSLATGQLNEYWLSPLSIATMLQAVSFFLLILNSKDRIEHFLGETAKRVVESISSSSYTIYLMHIIVLEHVTKYWIKYDYTKYNSLMITFGLASGTMFFSYVFSLGLRKIPVVRRLV